MENNLGYYFVHCNNELIHEWFNSNIFNIPLEFHQEFNLIEIYTMIQKISLTRKRVGRIIIFKGLLTSYFMRNLSISLFVRWWRMIDLARDTQLVYCDRVNLCVVRQSLFCSINKIRVQKNKTNRSFQLQLDLYCKHCHVASE